jgi:hypothetical protein
MIRVPSSPIFTLDAFLFHWTNQLVAFTPQRNSVKSICYILRWLHVSIVHITFYILVINHSNISGDAPVGNLIVVSSWDMTCAVQDNYMCIWPSPILCIDFASFILCTTLQTSLLVTGHHYSYI